MSVTDIPFDQIHLWTVCLDTAEEELSGSACPFSDHEVARAKSYKSERLQKRFLLGRLKLRQILSLYTGSPFEKLEFSRGSQGKPFLKNHTQIRFSHSQSGDTQMVAVASGLNVGIDLEKVRHDDFDAVARRFFSSDENALLQTLTGVEKLETFFRIWTRKEAYVKALGAGLAYPLTAFTVSGRVTDTDALIHDDYCDRSPMSWRVTDISAPAGYFAALAASGREWKSHYCQLPSS